MREDWFDTSMFYEQCYCAGMGNYLSCTNTATKRALETEDEERQARSTSSTHSVTADPSTDLATFMSELSNSK